MKPFRPLIMSAAALALLVLPAVLWLVWLDVSSANPDLTHAERSAGYLARFPEFLRNPVAVSALGLASSGCSILLSIFSMRDPRVWLRVANGMLILGGSVLLFLTFVPVI